MLKAETVIVIMAKQPRTGQAKTRLCPPLKPAEAAALAEALLLDTLALVSNRAHSELAIAISPPESQAYFESIAPAGTRLLPVAGPNIGACLSQALERLLAQGYRKALALNADGPSLPSEYLDLAVNHLETNDLVLGPGHDGGYYLIGLKRPHPGLFTQMTWSTGQVLAQTLARARQLGLRMALLPEWYDIDTGPDLLRLHAELGNLPANRLANTRRCLAHADWLDRLT